MLRKMLQACLGLFLCAQVVPAQVTTATISGVVQDESGAIVPGASITVTNLDTGMKRTVSTNAQGRYQAPNLPVGRYEVEAESAGFQTEIRRGIMMTVGREANVSFTLRVGTVTEEVVVTGEAPMVDPASSTVGGVVEPEQVSNLPLNTRSIDKLALLQPGVILGRNAGSQQSLSRGRGARIMVQGARPYDNNFMMDGTDINTYSNEAPSSVGGNMLGVEAIREFKVVSNSYDAQYGRNAGGAFSIVTKSGTNQFHGTLFEFFRNENLDARNFFDPGEPPAFVRNQFGGSLGGRIRRDKTFFFGTYEGLRQRLGKTLLRTVPSREAHQGFVPNPRTGELEFIGVAPGIQPWLDLYPLPNGRDFGDGTGERLDPFSESVNENLISVRLDHRFSDSDSFFVRWTGGFGDLRTVSGDNLVTFPVEDISENQWATIEEQHIFSPTLLNTFRVGFARSFAGDFLVPTIDTSGVPPLIPGTVPFVTGGTAFGFSPGSNIGDNSTPRVFALHTYQWSDDVFYTRGRHTLKFGGVVHRYAKIQNDEDSVGGDVSFSGGVGSLLRGQIEDFGVAGPGTTRHKQPRQELFGWYVQDDIQWLSNFTFNLGLRWEFVTDPREKHGRISNLINLFDEEFTVGKLIETEKDLFMPRFGFAWDPFRTGKTSIRGGFGMFYNQPLLNRTTTPAGSNPPFSFNLRINEGSFADAAQRVFQGRAEPELRPMTLQGTTLLYKYDFTIQRDIGAGIGLTAGYSGSLGRHLPRRGDENTRVPIIRPDGSKFFPRGAPDLNPRWASTRRVTFDTNSTYNAFVLSARKRFSQGLQFQVSYTLSKTIDAGQGIEGTESRNSRFQSMDPYDWKRDLALSEIDNRHNLVTSFSYELPFGQGKPFLNQVSGVADKIVGGWQINGILTGSSGTPLEILNGFPQSNNGASSPHDRPDLRPGGNNNPVLGSPDRWYDPSEFQLQEFGTYGNLGRNTVTGPDMVTFDFSLFKNTFIPSISEQFNVQFRAEFFNLLNRANFNTPNPTVFLRGGRPNGSAGRVDGTTTSSRQIQFALRVQF